MSLTMTEDRAADLLVRGDDRSSPSLENRVAYQWEGRSDVLGHRHGTIRDESILGYIIDNVPTSGPASVLDVGCGYGNHLFMLNSKLGKRDDLRLVGVNLDANQLAFAKKFSAGVTGYDNCEFHLADLSQGLPFDDGSFDVIALSDVLEHMDEPLRALQELIRLTRPGGAIVLSTPLKGSLFKKLASVANTLSGGRLYRGYYKGKNTTLDEHGQPVMEVHAGNDHVSEMTYKQLRALFAKANLKVEGVRFMQVMSGSRFFDRHPFVLSGMLAIEAMHTVLQRPSWAHSATFLLRVPSK